MIEDEELDKLESEHALTEHVQDSTPVESAPTPSEFAKTMDQVKVKVLEDASVSDNGFVETVKKNLKQAAVKHTEVEKAKADFAEQEVQFESEKLSTQQQKNQHVAAEDRWENKQKRREFHYNGVKPIMKFVDISEPMNLFILYFLTFVLTPFYLLSKLFKGTIGAVIAGASDSDRPKAVKGFLWTLIGLTAVCLLVCLLYLFFKWQGKIQ